MGRKTIPTHLKIVKGTAQKCRLNKNEPKLPPGIPEMPDHLGDIAQKKWKELSIQLFEMGVLAKIDGDTLAGCCRIYERWVIAERNITSEGETITTDKGNLIQSPWVSMANKCLELLRKFYVEFGLTPSSRSKVSGKKKEDSKNPWADF